MENLEQVRAVAAGPIARNTTKGDVNKLPALIINNGLLAATAFANEDNGRKRIQMAAVMNGVATHLAKLGIVPGATDARTLIEKLAAARSIELQRATGEALALIAYIKRFASKEG